MKCKLWLTESTTKVAGPESLNTVISSFNWKLGKICLFFSLVANCYMNKAAQLCLFFFFFLR